MAFVDRILTVHHCLVVLALPLIWTWGCKQRDLNDRSQAEAVTGVYDGRAHFLWPVVTKQGPALNDVQVCWYQANQPLPSGATEGHRFASTDVRRFFLESKAVGAPGSDPRFVPFTAFEQEALSSGQLGSLRGLGKLSVCGAAGAGATMTMLQRFMAKKSGKGGVVLTGAMGLLCAGSEIRAWTASPKVAVDPIDKRVHKNLEHYLRSGFDEDFRIEPRQHQALVKIITKVVNQANAAGTKYSAGGDICPQPQQALELVESTMTQFYKAGSPEGTVESSD